MGTAFIPGDGEAVTKTKQHIADLAAEEGLRVVGWRDVPTEPELLGSTARGCMPTFVQLFVAGANGRVVGMALERMAYCLRKRAEHETNVYFPSLSSRTLAYKGMLTTDQLDRFFPELTDERVASAMAVVHSRFSTNTFPSWPLAHPYRFIAHNGEINTVMGNRNWMRARESMLQSDLFNQVGAQGEAAGLDRLFPIVHTRRVRLGVVRRSPRAAAPRRSVAPARGADDDPGGVGEPHRDGPQRAGRSTSSTPSLMEPWDGPACVVFTDGTQIGAVLDRNGLRPSRYWVTDDGLVVLASEVGVLDIPTRVGRPQGPAAARPDVPRRPRREADHRGRRDQGRRSRPRRRTTSGCTPD